MSSLKKLKPLPSQEYLKECLDYDPDTGIFTWKERPIEHFKNKHLMNAWNAQRSSKQAGTVTSAGYMTIGLDGVKYLAHRLAWKMVTNDDPSILVDHKSRDTLDNKFNNLREATVAQNSQNSVAKKNNRINLKGVQKHAKKWRSRIWINGKNKHLGYFSSPETAHSAYCVAAKKYYGEFARFA